jgi:hypothetical protein
MHTDMFDSSPVERMSGTIAPLPTPLDRLLSSSEIEWLFSHQKGSGHEDSVSELADMFGITGMLGTGTNEP